MAEITISLLLDSPWLGGWRLSTISRIGDVNTFGEPSHDRIGPESVTHSIPAFFGVRPTWLGTSQVMGLRKISRE